MSWLDRLQKASYRGIEFLTESHEAQYGNRLVVHEYPGGDAAVVEDMGMKSPQWQVNAYFIGADYDQDRDRFLKILFTKGSADLIHPWLGVVNVYPQTWTVTESTDQGGYARVAVTFVTGVDQFVQAATDKTDVAISAIDDFKTKAMGVFKLVSMASGEVTSFIATVQNGMEWVRTVLSIATLPLTWSSQLFGLVDSIKGSAAELVALPGQYAKVLGTFADLLGSGQADANLDVAELSNALVLGQISTYTLAGVADDAVIAASVASDLDRPRLVKVFTKLVPDFTPAEALLAKQSAPSSAQFNLAFNIAQEKVLKAALFIASAAELALVDYRSSADRDYAVQSVAAMIDAVLPVLPDGVFDEAVAVRSAVIDALNAQDLADSSVRQVVNPLPAVVLAHRLQMDIDVFATVNAVRHPLFVRGKVVGY